MGLHLDAWWPQLPQGLAVLCPRALACLLSFLPARRCILLTLVQAVARTLCPWALGSGVSGFVVGPGGCCLWLPLTLVSPSVCFCFVFLFSSSPPCLPASLFFPASLFPSLPDHPVFPLLVPGGSPGEDLERNDGSQERPYFMSPQLRDILLQRSAEEGKQTEVED